MATLPTYAKLFLAGYKEKRESALIRTEMESGPPKQAKIRSRVMVTRSVSIQFNTLSDYQSFVSWFSTTINEGADWFTFTDPVSGLSSTGRFVCNGFDASPMAAVSGAWVINGLSIETWG